MEKWENLYAEAIHTVKDEVKKKNFRTQNTNGKERRHTQNKNERHPLKVLSMWHVSVCLLCAVISGGGILKMFQTPSNAAICSLKQTRTHPQIANSYTI